MRTAAYLSVYALFHVYFILRTVRFLRRNLPARMRGAIGWAAATLVVLAMSVPAAFFLPAGAARRQLQRLANGFEGLFLLLLAAYALCDLAGLLLRLIPSARRWLRRTGARRLLLGAAVWCVCIVTWVYGSIHASQLTIRHYETTVDKPCAAADSLRVVLIADTHLGCSVGAARVEDMVRRVNAQNADLIVFAGDIFDNTARDMDDPQAVQAALAGMKSRLGVYACWGNHDVNGRLFSGFSTVPAGQATRGQAMDDFVRGCGITMLEDEAVLLEDALWLIGRRDYAERDRAPIQALMAEVVPDMPVLVIDHEPRALADMAAAGVDVMLSGHTHDGQFFPLSLGINLVWENPCGMLRKDGMTSVVTAGVGVYGPDLRIGTDADITVVDIAFGAGE